MNEPQAQTHHSTFFSLGREGNHLFLLIYSVVQPDHASSFFQRGQKEILEALDGSGSMGKQSRASNTHCQKESPTESRFQLAL